MSSSAPRVPSAERDRGLGILLFLPVPIVLALFTRLPFVPSRPRTGIAISLAVGLAIMATHRLYARPWAVSRAGRRCLWCGGAARAPVPLTIDEPASARVSWVACCAAHADRSHAFVGWAERHALLLRVGILGGLVALLLGAWPAAAGWLGPLVPGDAVNAFRLLVALAVLPLGWLGVRAAAPRAAPRAPFPVHIQALVGSLAVAWLFRIVGLFWLGAAVWHAVQRSGGLS